MLDGATRQIAYYRRRNDLSRVYSTVVSSLELTMVAGIVCGIVMCVTAGLLADVFSRPKLEGCGMYLCHWGAILCCYRGAGGGVSRF